MTDDGLIELARAEGFEFGWRFVNGKPLVGFTRGDDTRYPAYGEERLAISCMRDWLRRGRVFASPLQSGQSVLEEAENGTGRLWRTSHRI